MPTASYRFCGGRWCWPARTCLQSVKIGADGRLEGFEQLVSDKGTGAAEGEVAVAITSHLLGLLVTFIGEPLTLKLVRASWPDISLDEQHSGIEGNS